jgi:transposase
MEKRDTRRLKPEVQEELRKQAIRLRKNGMAYREIGEALGVHHTSACTWYTAYVRDGMKAISMRRRGRRVGACRSLNSEQEQELKNLVIDKTPDQLKLPFALWTRQAVKEVIRDRYRIEMPIRSVGEYLKRWGFTAKKPVKRAYEQNPKVVQKWLHEEYPAIAARAKSEKAEIHWADETGIESNEYSARGYAPKGTTPVIHLNARKNHIGMISSISNHGQVRFMMYRESMHADLLIIFMRRLIKDTGRKVFLILDNLRVHHSKKVTKWLEKHKEEIEVFYLPSYSPELNPDEYLNGDLKGRIRSGLPARSVKDLEKKTRSFMRTLVKRPQHVRKYFRHPSVAYAA